MSDQPSHRGHIIHFRFSDIVNTSCSQFAFVGKKYFFVQRTWDLMALSAILHQIKGSPRTVQVESSRFHSAQNLSDLEKQVGAEMCSYIDQWPFWGNVQTNKKAAFTVNLAFCLSGISVCRALWQHREQLRAALKEKLVSKCHFHNVQEAKQSREMVFVQFALDYKCWPRLFELLMSSLEWPFCKCTDSKCNLPKSLSPDPDPTLNFLFSQHWLSFVISNYST